MESKMQSKNGLEWVDCNLAIRSHDKMLESSYELLSSEYEFENQVLGPFGSVISITFEKLIDYDPQLGHLWHKSWMLPNFRVEVSKQQFKKIKNYHQPHKIMCSVTAGYPKKENAHYFLEQVRMEGQLQKQLDQEGGCDFANLKFGQTSFNHSRNKFSLVVTVYSLDRDSQRTVIKSLISTPMLVDSRKEARVKIPKNIFIAEKVPYKKFIKSLESINKRKMRMKNRNQFIKYSKVQDSLQNFVNYYSAANIRYKIKHPFYFGYHFPKTLRVFYNSELVQNPFRLLSKIIKPVKPSFQLKYMYFLIQDDDQIERASKGASEPRAQSCPSEIEEAKKSKIKKMLFYNKKARSCEAAEDPQKQEATTVYYKRKFQKLLQSWKFYFIEVGQQSEVGILNKKWVEITRQEQLKTYLAHCKSYDPEQELMSEQEDKNEIVFQIRQIINLNRKPKFFQNSTCNSVENGGFKAGQREKAGQQIGFNFSERSEVEREFDIQKEPSEKCDQDQSVEMSGNQGFRSTIHIPNRKRSYAQNFQCRVLL